MVGLKRRDGIAVVVDRGGDELSGRIRALIKQADPGMLEERKWRKPSNRMAGVPVWSHHGIVCTGETYKNVVKMTSAKGAALKALIKAAVKHNASDRN